MKKIQIDENERIRSLKSPTFRHDLKNSSPENFWKIPVKILNKASESYLGQKTSYSHDRAFLEKIVNK